MASSKRPDEAEVIDAEFVVVKPARRARKRPHGTETWTDAQFEAWMKLPFWKRYETDWGAFAIIAAIALAGLIRSLVGE